MAKAVKSIGIGNFAQVDTDRYHRRGFSEVIYCPGKKREQIKKIAGVLSKQKQPLLFTRLDRKTFLYLKSYYSKLKYNSIGRVAYLNPDIPKRKEAVTIICAGTSDIPIAEEAATTLEAMGNFVIKLYDVGVAGIHRILEKKVVLRKSRVIIVVAGMEGALASIVSSLVACPVIAVPTSIGYGASFAGLAPLLTMLNSCSPGVAVVNIDNGFGAAYLASLINKL
jgi:hypothetical protein